MKLKIYLKIYSLILIAFLASSCSGNKPRKGLDRILGSGSTTASTNLDNAPTTSAITATDGYENLESTITLTYSDEDSDQADSCTISNLSNLTVTTSCSCSSGTCTVGVTGTSDYAGSVSFDYTVTANSSESNSSTVSFSLSNIGAASNEEWVYVPADAGSMGLDAFFIMKYEAKAWNDADSDSVIDSGEVDSDGTSVTAGSNLPISAEDDQPWRSINANDAASECESLGSGYHLMSNVEAMAIARDIEGVDANWTGSTVGSGCLFRGNSGETTCGYNSATDPDSGSSRDSRAKHTLSNGSEIYDFSGNVWEWTDWDKDTSGFQAGATSCTASWTELPSVACGALSDADYNSSNGSYTSTQGVGQLYGGTGGAALRGGDWAGTTVAGVFALVLNGSSTYTNTYIGFRCVFRP